MALFLKAHFQLTNTKEENLHVSWITLHDKADAVWYYIIHICITLHDFTYTVLMLYALTLLPGFDLSTDCGIQI